MKRLLDFYWQLRRIPTPQDWWREVKWFIQRGRRGWSDRDNFSMYNYVGVMMADMLKNLREIGFGYHCVHGAEVIEEHMMSSDDSCAEGWWELLHRVEFGLRYYEYVYDGDCSEHYGFDEWRTKMDSAQKVIVMAFADLGEYWGGMWW